MSVRIHEIAKAINKDNKEVLGILLDRGFEVKTVASTIDNISAAAFIEEFKEPEAPASEKEATPEPEPEETPPAPRVVLPAGAIVKSAADIERERREVQEQEKQRQSEELERRRQSRSPQTTPTPKEPESSSAAGRAPTLPSGAPPRPPQPMMRPPMPAPVRVRPESPSTRKSPVTDGPEVRIKQPGPSPAVPPRAAPGDVPVAPPRPSPEKEPSAPAPSGELIKVQVKPPIVVRQFAGLIGVRPFKLISELMDLGIFAGMNQTLEEDLASKIAIRHGYELEIRHRGEEQKTEAKTEAEPDHDDPALLQPRPPVVCVLGHVDHGKTTLLDAIRQAKVADGEAGGITQHIGAYQVVHNEHPITFIDTPGHAAFSKMRQRGANLTDVAILVVAADDGFMPQTDEGLKFAQKANVPVVVAVNKMDTKGANLDRVKQQMQDRGIAPEDWGGETLCVPISAVKGEGIPALLEALLLQAEILELKANPSRPAEGVVLESQVEAGRGCTATAIIRRGTLKVGQALVSRGCYCKVRAMVDEQGKPVKLALPATPVRILGWSEAPAIGSVFHAVKNEKEARREAEEYALEQNAQAQARAAQPQDDAPMDLDSLLAAIDQQKAKVLRVIIKSDVGGMAEALRDTFSDIKSERVELSVVASRVGPITKNDIELAHSTGAIVVGFNVRVEQGVSSLAKHHDVTMIQHSIIYELIDQVKEAMAELLDPEYRENKVGAAEVRQVFPLGKGFVAGCMITEGIVKRDAKIRVLRGDTVVHEGRVAALKRFKDDANEVRAGYECGIQVSGFHRYAEGDILECFEVLEIRPTL